ncbi:MAG TPA: C39 family peptidase, partial [Verrucomicrobiae bacterium]|nr:C39 family peptidase [Verrucomicrobiae bacterium]
RPELARDVPEVVHGVYDSGLDGTGNWPFNTAYAGSLPGMRGCVSRFSDVSELEDWIAKGLPVGLSVDYDRLRAKGPGPNGHLVVCVGFTKDGDPIINDPGTSKNVRKIFPRKNLIYAWSASHNAVYLIYPKGTRLPKDRFGHWPR